jgi:hypothetical protein
MGTGARRPVSCLYCWTTPAMQARIIAAIDDQLAPNCRVATNPLRADG